MTIDRHTLALISIVGGALDMLGALYLAYDLLGGEHGPLRTLTRWVTYGVLFGTGFGLALGPVFGLTTGVSTGFSLASRHEPEPGIWYDTVMSAIRGAGFGLGAAYLYGGAFGLTFAVLSTVGQAIGYRFGMRPDMDYEPAARPRLTRRQLLGVGIRTVGYAGAGFLSAFIAHRSEIELSIALKFGLVIGVVTMIVGSGMS